MENKFKSLGIAGEVVAKGHDRLKVWQDLHYGMFIHFGIYSSLAGVWNGERVTKGYSEQIQMWANISMKDYADASKQFTLEHFDAKEIVTLAKEAGMKYIVITSKHHDGFCMFDTKTTDYNVVKSTPFAQDVLKLLADECRKQGLKFGIYFSLVDWHQGHVFDLDNNNEIPSSMELIIEAQLKELMTNYGTISEVWFDMSSPSIEQSVKFQTLVHQLQPEAAINGRIWNNKGDFRTLDDNQVPTDHLDGAWQTPASIYKATWGYRNWQVRDDFTGKVTDLLKALISIRARGGNYLLNIGPRGDGSIVAFEADVLREIGAWIQRHPQALLGTNPTHFNQQSWGEITVNDTSLYLHVLNIPKDRIITLRGLLTDVATVEEDGFDNSLKWYKDNDELKITLPEDLADDLLTTIKVSLKDELYIIPKAVSLEHDDTWKIGPEDIEYGYNFADGGNYTSMRKTNVRQSIYIENNQDAEVFISIAGMANVKNNYEVRFHSQVEYVSGAVLTKESIGPFTIDRDHKILPLHIRLYEPAHENEEMDLKIESIMIKSVN